MSTIILKRSATPAKVPLTSDLGLGELAMNTYDGKLYLKKSNGDVIVEIGKEPPSFVGTGAVSGSGLTGSATGANSTFTVTSNATDASTASTIVFRDANRNFSANVVTANLVGNASTSSSAAILTTGRTIGVSGITGGAQSFNGSANITIPITDVPATLLSGTVANGRLSGLYSGMGIKSDGTSTSIMTPSSGSISALGRVVTDLAQYRSSTTTPTGAIVFKQNNTTSSIMYNLTVEGNAYSTPHIIKIAVFGYRINGAWVNTRKINYGTYDVQARFGITPAGENCLILGDVATVWPQYIHLAITKAFFGHTNTSDAITSGWTTELVTDLSSYTQVIATLSDTALVTDVTGNANTATTLATGRTIGVSGITGTAQSFNGSANITIPITDVPATLLSGTIADARIGGSYTGMTNLTGSGSVDFAYFLGTAVDTAALPSFTWTGDLDTGIYRPAADSLSLTAGGVARFTANATGSYIAANSFYVPNGSVALPSISFANDDDIGLYRVAANQLGLSTGGQRRKLWLSTGEYLFATDQAPIFRLRRDYTVGSANNNVAGYIDFEDLDSIDTAFIGTRMLSTTLDNTTTLTNSQFTLQVRRDGSFFTHMQMSNGYISVGIGTEALPGINFIGDTDTGMWRSAANQLQLVTAGVARLTANSAGIHATTFTGALTGNATTATTLATGRTIAISGGVTGTATSFDGSANITIPITAMDAGALSTGVLLDARISGAYTGFTSITGTANSNFVTYRATANGTVALPAYTFTADPDTGIYGIAANQIGITTGGAVRLTANASGIIVTGNAAVSANVSATSLILTGSLKCGTTTVAGLVAAATAGAGTRHFVTNATANTFYSVVAGGGAIGVPVFSDGTNWRIG